MFLFFSFHEDIKCGDNMLDVHIELNRTIVEFFISFCYFPPEWSNVNTHSEVRRM